MTAISRASSAPVWLLDGHGMVMSEEPPQVTVSITVRGDDAISAIAPLVAAVRLIGRAEVSVAALPGPRRPEANGSGYDGYPRLHILTEQYTALLDGVELPLTRREFDLLLYLAEHPRRVFSRVQLLQAVWGYDFNGGGRTVDVHVRRLRQKLGSTGPSISTVRGVGYRLDDCERVLVTTAHG
jgi:two-component system, OmpR family, response regulator